jgi:hypothetical protein
MLTFYSYISKTNKYVASGYGHVPPKDCRTSKRKSLTPIPSNAGLEMKVQLSRCDKVLVDVA